MFRIRVWQLRDATPHWTKYTRPGRPRTFKQFWRRYVLRKYVWVAGEHRTVLTPEGARIEALFEAAIDQCVHDWERDEWGRLVNKPTSHGIGGR